MKNYKNILVASIFLLVVCGASGLSFYLKSSQRPLYQPGSLARSATLDPVTTDATQNRFELEPTIFVQVQKTGSGSPLIFLHGGPSRPYATLPQPPPGYAFISWHQRGSGLSTRVITKFDSPDFDINKRQLESSLGLSAQVGDIERVRRVLKLEQLTLVAEDFGCILAALYAAEFPDRVKGIIFVRPVDLLVMPSAGNPLALIGRKLTGANRTQYDAFLGPFVDTKGILSKTEEQALVETNEYFRFLSIAQGNSEQEPAYEIAGAFAQQAFFSSLGFAHDWRLMLKQLRMPMLVIHAENDLQSEGLSRNFGLAFPHTDFALAKNVGPFMLTNNPEVFAAIATPFLSTLK
jgi:proline iminopeptidase